MNDYRGQVDPINREETFPVSRPGLIELLTSWSDKPELPPPMILIADDPA